MAAQQEQGEPSPEDKAAQMQQAAPMKKAEDVMADTLLDRIEENPQQLLRGQFYIDAQTANTTTPQQTW